MARFPFFSMSIRNIKRSKLRSIMLLAGVALTVSLQIGIAVAVDSLTEDFIQTNRNHNFTDITVHSATQMTITEINNQLIPIIESLKGIEKISPVITTSLTNILVGDNIQRDSIFYGCSSSHPDLYSFDLVDGKRSLDSDEVILSDHIARLLALDAGDTLTLDAIPGEGFLGGSFSVSAIMEDGYPFGNLIDFAYIIINYDVLLDLYESTTNMDIFVALSVPNLLQLNGISVELSDLLPDYIVIREKYIDELKETGLTSYQTAMDVLILASYLIEFLFITNIFAFSMKERSKEFGILRSIGTAKKQVILLILTEAFLIGLFGSIIGGIGGLGFAGLLLYIFKYTLGFSSLQALVISPVTLIISILTGITVTLLSGLWPLWITMSMPIVSTIHNAQIYKKTSRKIINWKTALITGTIFIIAGLFTVNIIEQTSFLGFEIGSAQTLVIALIFSGVVIIEAAIVSFIPKIGIRLLIRSKLAPLLLATKDIERDMQKAMITIFTAAFALSLILIVSMVSSGLFSAVPEFYEESFGDNLNIVIETWDHLEFPNTFADTLLDEFNWVHHTSFIQEQRTSFVTGGTAHFFGVDASTMNFFIDEFILQPESASLTTLIDNTSTRVVITDTLKERLGYDLGDTLNVKTVYGTNGSLIISGITHGNPFIRNGEYIFVDTDIFQQLWNKTTSKWFWGDYDQNFPNKSVVIDIEETFIDIKSVMTIFDYQAMIEYSLGVQGSFIQLIFIHSFILSGLTQFIAILISTMRMERDVAITRSIGLSKRRVFYVFLAEASVLGFTGVFLGIINSFVGSELLAWYIGQSIPINVSIDSLVDQTMFLLWIFLASLVTLGSTWIPARRASQVNIIAAISGRKELKTALSYYKPAEFDIHAIIDRMHTPPKYIKDEEATAEKISESTDKSTVQAFLDQIADLLKQKTTTSEENSKWYKIFQTQNDKYEKGLIDEQRFSVTLKRYIKYLKEN